MFLILNHNEKTMKCISYVNARYWLLVWYLYYGNALGTTRVDSVLPSNLVRYYDSFHWNYFFVPPAIIVISNLNLKMCFHFPLISWPNLELRLYCVKYVLLNVWNGFKIIYIVQYWGNCHFGQRNVRCRHISHTVLQPCDRRVVDSPEVRRLMVKNITLCITAMW